jgi:PilZ domain
MEPQETEVLTTDVSRGGLSLLCRKQFFPGQQVLLVLNETNRLVEICWCCRVWSGLYSAGCKFISAPPMPAEEA